MTTPKISESHPCVFKNVEVKDFIKEVDARVQTAWIDKRPGEGSLDFGNMRRIWRVRHCSKLNRYSSDDCPFPKRACAMAYEVNAIQAIEDGRDPYGWFWARAKMSALVRADMRPHNRTDGPSRSSHARSSREGLAAGQRGDAGGRNQSTDRVSRPSSGPQRIGELLGPYHDRAREMGTTSRKESEKP